jgi:LPS-assembly protein
MRKLLLWFWLGISALIAAENVEVYAIALDSNATHVYASGDVLVIYQDSYLTADAMTYDRNSSILELLGNVTILKGSDYQAIGEYVSFDTKDKERTISPFFMLDKSSKVWLSASEGHACENDYDLRKGIVSGCDPNDPLWKIYFSSSDYDAKSKWMNLYNARFNIYDIPIFYFPYFGYSLDTKRRSGLLTPSLGLSSSEGFFYQQPLYLVLDDWWDLELRPQFRTERGAGVYGTLRFVDSRVSEGDVTLGYFKEQQSYVNEFNLEHDKHYGFGINYENHAFLREWLGLKWQGQSGFYTDVTWMNDIDYLNLSDNDETKNATSNQIFSRVNMFYNEEENYYGAYLRYFLDLNQPNNDETIQNLPILQYHHYLDAYLKDHLFYNVNLNVNNYERKVGRTATQAELDIPLTLQTSVLDDYLDLSYRAQLYGRHVTFGGDVEGNTTSAYQPGNFGRFYHIFTAGSYLTRGFEGFSHSVGLSATYVRAGNDYTGGYYEEMREFCSDPVNVGSVDCEFYTLTDIEDETRMQFTQYLFDDHGKQILYHRLAQTINYDPIKERLGEFENELEYRITDAITFYDDTFYNHQRKAVSKTINSLRYNDGRYNVGFSYLHEDKGPLTVLQRYANYLNADASYRYDRHYRYFAKFAYDFETALKKFVEVGFLYSKRCWDFGLRYVENNRPILQSGGEASSVYDKYIYFTVMLKPIGGSEVSYKVTDALQSR